MLTVHKNLRLFDGPLSTQENWGEDHFFFEQSSISNDTGCLPVKNCGISSSRKK